MGVATLFIVSDRNVIEGKKYIMQKSELSRSREGENQRSDQASIRRDSNNGRIRDFVAYQCQLSDQQQYEGKGKGIMVQEVKARPQREEIERVIKQRGGKTSGEIPLGYQDGLRGGIGPKDFLTEDEQEDYDAAPDTPLRRSTAEDNAVRLYSRARDLIHVGYDEDEIPEKLDEYRNEYHQERGNNRNDGIDWSRALAIQSCVDKLVNVGANDGCNRYPDALSQSDPRRSMFESKMNVKEFNYASYYLRKSHGDLSAREDNVIVYLLGAYYTE